MLWSSTERIQVKCIHLTTREDRVPESGMQNFSIQGLSDALTSLESEVTVVQSLAEKYALLLEVTMAD